MQYVSATEAKQELGTLLDTAQRSPVTIRKHKRDYAVILSIAEYERLRQAAMELSEPPNPEELTRILDELG
jgi:prevent-host-death family protein